MKARRLTVFCLAALWFAPVGIAAGVVVYVDDDAPGGDGTSWAIAFKYLQDALATANANDEIRVAQGTYVPDRSSAHPSGSGDREATFQIINGVAIYGGYAGYGEPDPNNRDVDAYETILSGDLSGNDVLPSSPEQLLDEPTRSDNCYHVVTSMMMMFETIALNGLTITAGHANDINEYPRYIGGGMYNENTTPTIIDCTFKDNCARYSGGGMYNGHNSATIVDCTFQDNYAGTYGGGLYWRRLDHENDNLIRNCAFLGNAAHSGAGFFNDTGDSLPEQNVVNCVFADNVATDRGGGIFNDESFMDLKNCVFLNNSASAEGGAIFNDDTYANLTHCLLSGNSAGRNGGGIANSQVRMWLTNCTIVGNAAGEQGGGEFDYVDSDIYVTNCILWNNSAYEGPQLAMKSRTNLFVRYSCFQGGRLDIYDDGSGSVHWSDSINTDADPMFFDPGHWSTGTWVEGDYHLKSQAGRWNPIKGSWEVDADTSPCVDAGDPNSVWTAELWPHGKRINMGAFGGTPQASMSQSSIGNIADLNHSNNVNSVDMILLANQWLREQILLPEDLDRNGFVNAKDFAVFAREWLWEQ